MQIQIRILLMSAFCCFGLAAHAEDNLLPDAEKISPIVDSLIADAGNISALGQQFMKRNEGRNLDYCATLSEIEDVMFLTASSIQSELKLYQFIGSNKSISETDKRSALITVRIDISFAIKRIDGRIKIVNNVLAATKSPAVALEGQRLRDHMQQLRALLAP